VSAELTAGIIGGFVGGALGVVATVVSSYYGPRKLEEWRERRKDEPKKRLLRVLLNDPKFPEGRYLDTLCMYTGSPPEECRRLLIEIEARGIRLQGRKGPEKEEGWALIKNMPLDQA
jgi:hypothetical protein